MTEVISRNEFDKSYLLMKRAKEKNNYVVNMLTQNSIQGLLECKIRYLEETEYLAYDVTAKKSLEKMYSDKKIGFEDLTELFYGMNRIMHHANNYLLNREGFWLDPKYMFTDLDTGELYCLYCPIMEFMEQTGEVKYRQLADFLLDKIDHKDEHAVNIAYHFYKLSKEEYFSFDSFIGFMEKECLLVQAKKQNVKPENKPRISKDAEDNLIMNNTVQENRDDKHTNSKRWRSVAGIFILGLVLVFAYLFVPYLHGYALYSLVPGVTFMMLAIGLLVWKLVCIYKENDSYTYDELQEPVRIEEYFDNVVDDVTVFFDQDEFLQLKWKEGHFSKEFILDEFPVTVGKMQSSVQMLIEDASISRLHARLRQQGNTIYLQDLDSTNGTYVNGKQLFPGEEMIIKRGDEIQFGKIKVNVV